MTAAAERASRIARLGVVGAGQMGRGIAQVAAAAGIDVVLIDATPDVAAQGIVQIVHVLDRLVDKGKLERARRDETARRLRAGAGLPDLAEAEIVIEAATEQAETKQRLFEALDRVVREEAVLATNTSSIGITGLGARTRRPDRVIGMHFMNPVPIMKLVEIIRGLATSDETYELVRALAVRLGKETVLSRDVPGFIVNRVLMPLVNEACFALYEGLATAEDIDKAVHLGLNHPMGPLALADLIGLDTTLAILEVLHRELGDDKYRPCPLLRQYVAAGWFGRKTGRGFYRY